jgi:hypothetical protein
VKGMGRDPGPDSRRAWGPLRTIADDGLRAMRPTVAWDQQPGSLPALNARRPL